MPFVTSHKGVCLYYYEGSAANVPKLKRKPQRQLTDASIYSRATDYTERR
jgi:hypothetical protein